MQEFIRKIAGILAVSVVCGMASGMVQAAPTAEPQASVEPLASAIPQESAEPQESSEPQATIEPQESAEPDTTPALQSSLLPAGEYTSNTLDFNINITYRRYVIDSFIKVGVYNTNGELIATERQWVGGVTRNVKLHYNIPAYTLGETFIVKLESGAETLSYYDKKICVGETFEIKTGVYYNSSNRLVAANSFNFDAVPLWEKEVSVYVEDKKLSLSPRARVVDDMVFVPVRQAAKALGLDVSYDKKYDSVVCSVGDKEIIFNLGTTYATFFGKTTYLPSAPRYIQNCAYVPIRPLAEAFEAPIDVKYADQRMDIMVGESEVVKKYLEDGPVNKWNISSSTDYMVWVSKSEYKVRMYKGSKNNWKLIYTAPCAIGAPGTPTITGSYEYIERTQWNYDGYYVGPVLRFHNGYALHSTLLYYGGGEYDGRVGVQISHGCIRLHPQDINHIANTIPFKTRIYITE